MPQIGVLADAHSVEQAKAYLKQGETLRFFELVTAHLLRVKSPHPVQTALDYVRTLGEATDKLRTLHEYKEAAETEEGGTLTSPDEQDSKDILYMKKHNVSDFLDKWVLKLVADKVGACELEEGQLPEDLASLDPFNRNAGEIRYSFHVRYLADLLSGQESSKKEK